MEIPNNNLLNSTWQSIREKWTVTYAIVILMVSFFVIVSIFLYVVLQNNASLTDKILTIFNSFIMAVLGYLFGYVPSKASELSAKRDKESTEEQFMELNQAFDENRDILEKKERIIKRYETVIALLESEKK